MKTKLKLMTAALILSGSMAFSAVTSDQLVSQYQAEGYTWIEVKVGLTQIKVEAVKGARKIEVTYDKETGAVLKSETESASAFEQGRDGVQVRNRNRDFVRQSSSSDDDDDDDDSRDDDDDDHDGDNSGHGGGDDDDDDDDDDDHGGSDDDDDDDDDSGSDDDDDDSDSDDD